MVVSNLSIILHVNLFLGERYSGVCLFWTFSDTIDTHYNIYLFYYRTQAKLQEGNVFTRVCHSVHGGGLLPKKADPPDTLLA